MVPSDLMGGIAQHAALFLPSKQWMEPDVPNFKVGAIGHCVHCLQLQHCHHGLRSNGNRNGSVNTALVCLGL